MEQNKEVSIAEKDLKAIAALTYEQQELIKNIENELIILKKTDERVNEIYAKYGLFDWWIKNNCEGYHD